MTPHQVLQGLYQLFWLCLAASVACAAFVYFRIRHRRRFLQMLDAEDSFWRWIGVRKTPKVFQKEGATRRFLESHLFTALYVLFGVVFLNLAVSVGLYLYNLHKFLRR